MSSKHIKTIKIFYFSKIKKNVESLIKDLNQRICCMEYIEKNHSFTVLAGKILLSKQFFNITHGVKFSLKDMKWTDAHVEKRIIPFLE